MHEKVVQSKLLHNIRPWMVNESMLENVRDTSGLVCISIEEHIKSFLHVLPLSVIATFIRAYAYIYYAYNWAIPLLRQFSTLGSFVGIHHSNRVIPERRTFILDPQL